MGGSGGAAATSSRAARVLVDEIVDVLGANRDKRGAELEHANEEIDGLREALQSRTVIGQALGILMAEKGLSTDEAFAELVEASSQSNVKVRDVAARMVQLADADVERRRHSSA